MPKKTIVGVKQAKPVNWRVTLEFTSGEVVETTTYHYYADDALRYVLERLRSTTHPNGVALVTMLLVERA